MTLLFDRLVMLFVIATVVQTYILQAEGDQQIASKGPVSLKEARNIHLGIPLPDSASEIQYDLKVSGLQQMSLYLRFQVAPQEADHAVQAIIDNNNRIMNRSLVFSAVPLPIPESEPHKDDMSQTNAKRSIAKEPNWWIPQKITDGYIRSELASYAPFIIYDKERSIIYVRQID